MTLQSKIMVRTSKKQIIFTGYAGAPASYSDFSDDEIDKLLCSWLIS